MSQPPLTNFAKIALLASKKTFFYIGLFSFFENLLILTVPIYMLQIFDRVLVSQGHATLYFLTLLAIFALLALGGLNIVRSHILIILSHWLDNRLSPEAMRLSADNLLQGNNYALQALGDIQQLRNFLASPQVFALFDIPWTPLFVLVIFLLHPALGWFTLVGALVLFLLAVLNELLTRAVVEDCQKASIETQQHLQSMMANSEVIMAMGMMEDVIMHWTNKNAKTTSLSSRASRYTSIIMGATKFMRLALQIGILGFGAYLVIENKITAGTMITASILLTRTYSPIDQAIGAWKGFISARFSYQRLSSYFLSPEKRQEKKVLQTVEGNLKVHEASYIPPGKETPSLKNINFTLAAGETLLIIGASGAGKTTLARLLLGIIPTSSGEVLLDQAEVYGWPRAKLGQQVGYLPQDLELFMGTIEQNISRMQKGTEEAIIKASQMVGAHEFILRLANGYNTMLSDVGRSLSGGQRQQIAIARAFYKEPALIVLDEPLTFLDAENQKKLLGSILYLKKKGKTIVVISHNPVMINCADKILWMEQGEQVMFGNKTEVLQVIQSRKDPIRKSRVIKDEQ